MNNVDADTGGGTPFSKNVIAAGSGEFEVLDYISNPVFVFDADRVLIARNNAAKGYSTAFLQFCGNSKEALYYFDNISPDKHFSFTARGHAFSCSVNYNARSKQYIVTLNNVDHIVEARENVLKKLALYEQVLNNVPVDLVILNELHQYVFVNKFAIKNDEIREWVIGKNDYDYVAMRGMAVEIADRRRNFFNRCIAERKTVEVEDETVNIENQRKTTLRRFTPLYNTDGSLMFVLGFGIDITERKKIELELLDSERKYKSLFHSNIVGVFRANMDGTITHSNNALGKILRSGNIENVNNINSLDKLMHWESEDDNPIAIFKSKGRLENFELDISPDGRSARTLLVNMTSVRLKDEPSSYILGTVIDITEQKNTRVKLEKSEERYRLILNSALDIIISLTSDGTIYFQSESLSRALGYDKEVLHDSPLTRFLTEESKSKFNTLFSNVMSGAPIYLMELDFIGRDGNVITMEGNMTHSRFTDNEQGAQVFFRDITLRREQENILRKSLEEKEILIKEVHHRVKNNLTVIYSLLELDSSKLEDEVLKEVFASSQTRVKSMAVVHENLYQSNVSSRLEIINYTKKLFSEISSIYGRDGKDVVLTIPDHSLFINIDQAVPVGLILNELIVNFYKYVYPVVAEPVLEIDFFIDKLDPRIINLHYQDNGPGIVAAATPGSGVGSMLVGMLAKQLKGKIVASSASGYTFELKWKA